MEEPLTLAALQRTFTNLQPDAYVQPLLYIWGASMYALFARIDGTSEALCASFKKYTQVHPFFF